MTELGKMVHVGNNAILNDVLRRMLVSTKEKPADLNSEDLRLFKDLKPFRIHGDPA